MKLEFTEEFLSKLEKMHPDRCPSVDTPERQIWFDAGAAKVVKYLRQLYNKQFTGDK